MSFKLHFSGRPTHSPHLSQNDIWSTFSKGEESEIDSLIKNYPKCLLREEPETGSIPLFILLEKKHWHLTDKILDRIGKSDLKRRWVKKHSKYPFQLFKKAFEIEQNVNDKYDVEIFLRKLTSVVLELSAIQFFDEWRLFEYLRNFFKNRSSEKTEDLAAFDDLLVSFNKIEEIWEQLKEACRKGNYDEIEKIYKQFPDLILRNDPQTLDNPLHILYVNGHLKVAGKVTEWIKEMQDELADNTSAESYSTNPFEQRNRQGPSPLTLVEEFSKTNPEKKDQAEKLKQTMRPHKITQSVSEDRENVETQTDIKIYALNHLEEDLWSEASEYCKTGNLNKLKIFLVTHSDYLTKKEPMTKKTLLKIACVQKQWLVALFLIEKELTKKQLEGELQGITKIGTLENTLIFTFESLDDLNKANHYFGKIQAEIIPASGAGYILADDKEESEVKSAPLIASDSHEISLKVTLKQESIKNFSRNFAAYWKRDYYSISTSGEIRFNESTQQSENESELQFVKNHQKNKINKKLMKTQKILHQIESRNKSKEQPAQGKPQPVPKPKALSLNLVSPAIGIQIPSTTQFLEVESVASAKADPRIDQIPDKIIDRRGEEEKTQEIENKQIKGKRRKRRNRARKKKLFLGNAQQERVNLALTKFLEFESLKVKLQGEERIISMTFKLTLLESLMQALETLYPTSDQAPTLEDIQEKVFFDLINHYCISQKEAKKLRRIIRSYPFVIDDAALMDLIQFYDQCPLSIRLKQIQEYIFEAPISLKNCAIFKNYAQWQMQQEKMDTYAYEKNHFYFNLCLETVSKLRETQITIRTEISARIEFTKLTVVEQPSTFYIFTTIFENSKQLCEASKKLLTDLQKFIFKLDKNLVKKLKKSMCVRATYQLGMDAAPQFVKLLEESGEMPTISSETIYNLLIQDQYFTNNLFNCITRIKNADERKAKK